MRFNKIKKICVVISLMGICFLSSVRAVDYLKCDIYEYGDWWTTNEKASNQTWAEFWQAYLDNPYQTSTYAKAQARWVIANGLADKSPEEVNQAWLDAGEPGYTDGTNNKKVENNAEKQPDVSDTTDASIDKKSKVDSVDSDTNTSHNTKVNEEWKESSRTEATCTKNGEITYTEQNSGKTKTETIAAVGHAKGKAEITTQPTLFNKGEQVIKCTRCGEVLESKVLPAKVPAYIWGILVGSVLVVVTASAYFVKTKKC